MSTVYECPAVQAPRPTDPDYTLIKQRQQATWASGDYAMIGVRLQIVGETLAEAVDLRAGERVIDIAAGNGNATLAAGRRFAEVTSTDYVPELLEKSRARALADGLDIRYQVADAESLPFGDAAFDVALSTFGAMFSSDHRRTAQEMLRVVRPGGRIGLANWTPEGIIGQLFKLVGSYVPPPAGVKSPALWGTEPHIVELFGPYAESIRCERRTYNFRYRSPEHWLQVFRDFYGPIHRAFGALDARRQKDFAGDLIALLNRFNTAGAASLVAPGEYLEVVIVRGR